LVAKTGILENILMNKIKGIRSAVINTFWLS